MICTYLILGVLECLLTEIVALDGEAVLDEVASHWHTHVAQADEANLLLYWKSLS